MSNTEDFDALGRRIAQLVGKDEEQEVKVALFTLAAGARRDFPEAKHLILDDSDQGPWLVIYGVEIDGEVVDAGTNDDWEPYASNLYDNRTYVYNPYLLEEATADPGRRFGPYTVIIDKVLADRNNLLGIPPEVVIDGNRLLCPHKGCGGLDNLVVHDRADRYSECSTVWIEDGKLVQIDWSRGDDEFHTQGYSCNACGQAVTLPDNPHEEWS